MDWKQKRGAGCLALFALPFAAVGAIAGWMAVSHVSRAMETASWVPTPARILSVDLIENHGEDSTTWRVEATYEYDRDGFTYRSDRVALSSLSDNIGSFQRDAYRELAAHRDSGEPFTAFVDPDDPRRAVLYRQLRWGLLGLQLIFALTFGGVGFGLLAAVLVGSRIATEEQRLRQRHPQEPWRHKKDWADGRIPSGSRTKWIALASFAAFWNLISAPLWFLIPEKVGDGDPAILLALLFPLVGVGLAAWAVRGWLQWRRFGDSTLEMDPFPGVLGGPVRGRVLTRLQERPESGVRASLSCIRREVSGSGRNRRRSERILWQDARRIPRENLQIGPDGVTVPIEFEVPYELEPSDMEEDVREPVLWRLSLDSDIPGVDYEASFEVPVFRTGDSDPRLQMATETGDADTDVRELADLAAEGIRLTPLPAGGLRLELGRARQPLAALGLSVFTLIWAGVVVALAYSSAPMIFPVIFGAFLVLLLLATVQMWLSTSRIEAEPGRLRFARGTLWMGAMREISAAQIARIEPERGVQAGRHLYYRIVAETRSGDEHVLATLIDDLALARRLVAEIDARLGDRERPPPAS